MLEVETTAAGTKPSGDLMRLQSDGIYLKEGSSVAFFPWVELVLVASEDHQTCFSDGVRRVVIRTSLSNIENELTGRGLIRVNRQSIVNLRHVRKIMTGPKARVYLSDGKSYSITRRRRSQFVKAHEDFLAQQSLNRAKYAPLRTVRRSLDALGSEKLWIPTVSLIRNFLRNHTDLAVDKHQAFEFLAQTPVGHWLGAWTTDLIREVRPLVIEANSAGEIPVFVIYRLLLRDETKVHKPSILDLMSYKQWIRTLVQAIGHYKCIVILEPNALSMMDSQMPTEVQDIYYEALRFAIATLSSRSQILIYLDAGHAAWVAPSEISIRLARAGIDFAHGFAVNVSSFIPMDEIYEYGTVISEMLGGKPFVIDTSRNGQGTKDARNWCNPSGVGLGRLPTLKPRLKGVDAFLWVKPPGESDSGCEDRSPKNGEWLPAHAWDLIKMAKTSG